MHIPRVPLEQQVCLVLYVVANTDLDLSEHEFHFVT